MHPGLRAIAAAVAIALLPLEAEAATDEVVVRVRDGSAPATTAVVERVPAGHFNDALKEELAACRHNWPLSACPNLVKQLLAHEQKVRPTRGLAPPGDTFRFQRAPGVRYFVWAHTPDKASSAAWVPLTEHEVALDLHPTPMRSGRIINREAQPVAGAQITIVHAETGLISRTTTTVDGRFAVRDLPTGAVDVLVARAGKLVGFTSLDDGATRELMVVTTHPVQGRVVEGERPVANAEVQLISGSDGDVAAEARTDARGNFVLPNVMSFFGTSKVRARLNERVGVVEVELEEKEAPAPLVIRLRKGLRLTGQVVSDAGRPVKGADVHATSCDGAQELRTPSADDGRFSVGPLPPGCIRLQVEATEHLPSGQELELTTRTRPLTMTLTAQQPLTGVVVDDTGAPVPYSNVTLCHGWTERCFDAYEQLTTDSAGRFTAERPYRAPLRLDVSREGHADASALVEDVKKPARVLLTREAVLRVHVVDEEERPLPKVMVALRQPLRKSLSTSGFTDAAGEATFHGVWRRTEVFVFQKGNPGKKVDYLDPHWTARRDIETSPGERVEWTFKLERLTTDTIELVDESGKRVTDATLKPADYEIQKHPEIEKMADGLFEVRRKQGTTHEVQADSKERVLAKIAIAAEARHQKVVLKKAAVLTGRLVDQRGKPVTRVLFGGDWVADDNGAFRFRHSDLWHKDWRYPDSIEICASGYAPGRIPLPAENGSDVRMPDIVLEEGRTLTGRVIDADTKRPVLNAKLSVSVPGILSSADECALGSRVAPSDGTFVVRHVPSSASTLDTDAPGYERGSVDLKGSRDQPFVIGLKRRR